jgi:hypothetical protein
MCYIRGYAGRKLLSTLKIRCRAWDVSMSLRRTYKTWAELVADSSMVVVGVAGTQTQRHGRLGLPETTTAFEVETPVLERGGEGHSVVCVQQIGPVPQHTWADETWPLPAPGERFLLFLVLAPHKGVYFPVGAYQGVYHVTPDDQLQTVRPEAPWLRELTRGATLGQVRALIRAIQ